MRNAVPHSAQFCIIRIEDVPVPQAQLQSFATFCSLNVEDWISSTRPSVRSLATIFPAEPPISSDGRFRAPSSRCEAAASTRRCIAQFHGILHSVATAIGAATTEAPQWPSCRQGRIPQGAICARNGDSTARFAPESQFFLDHLVAQAERIMIQSASEPDRMSPRAPRCCVHNRLVVSSSPASPTTQSRATPVSRRARNSL
jgi:hypothetical protein